MSRNTKKKATQQLQSSVNSIEQNMINAEKRIDSLSNAAEATIKMQNEMIASLKQVASTTSTTAQAVGQATKSTTLAGEAFSFLSGEIASFAFGKILETAISIGINAWDRYVHALDYAREALENTKAELSDVHDQMGNVRKQIDHLEARDPASLSIVDKRDLETLKEQNKELENREQFLQRQKVIDADKVSEEAKKDYHGKYGYDSTDFSADKINEFKTYYQEQQKTRLNLAPDLSGGPLPELPGNAAELDSQDQTLASLIALYELYTEHKKEAIDSNDTEAVEHYSQRISETEDLLDTIHGDLINYQESISANNKHSQELDNISEKLYYLDQTFNSKRDQLLEYLSRPELSDTKFELMDLNYRDQITDNLLKNRYPDVSSFLTEQGLTAQDLNQYLKENTEKLKIDTSAIDTEPITLELEIEPDQSLDQTLSGQIMLLNDMADQLSSVRTLYQEFLQASPEGFSTEALSAFAETFKSIEGVDAEHFLDILTSGVSTAGELQQAFNDLSTQYITASGCLETLTAANAKQTIASLESQGILNAEAIITDYLRTRQEELAAGKFYSAYASDQLRLMTEAEWAAFSNEAAMADIATAALARLELAKLAAGGAVIDMNSDIDQIIALANAAGASASVIEKLNFTKEDIINGLIDPTSANFDGYALRNYESVKAELNAGTFNFEFQKLDPAEFKVAPSGGSARGGGSGSHAAQTVNQEQREQFNWIERKLKLLERKHQDINAILQDETKSYLTQDAAITNLIALNEEKIKTLQGQAEEYKKDRDSALKSISDEQLQTLGFDISKEDLFNNLRDGSMDISEFILPEGASDELKELFDAVIKSIKEAQSAYTGLEDTEESIADTEEENRDLQKERFEKRMAEIKAENDALKNRQSTLQAEIDLLEAAGGVVTAGLYEEMIELSKEQEELYAREADAARERMSEVEHGSEEYYQLSGQIENCETSILSCKKAQAEWTEAIKRIPIQKIRRYLELLSHAKEDLQNFIDEQSALGIETNQSQYQQLIQISREQMNKLLEQQDLLKDRLTDYEYNSDKYNEVAGEIQDIDNEISSLIQSQHEWNKAMMEIPVNALNKTNDTLQAISGSLGTMLSEYDSVISTITATVDQEIDSINELKDAAGEYYDTLITPLQEQLDLLQKTNDERQVTLALEKAQYELEKARSQKKIATIRNGELVYESDSDALRNAEEALLDAGYNKTVHDLESQITAWEEERDALLEGYDEQIEKLDLIKEKWSELVHDITLAADTIKATELLGEGWQNIILSGNDAAMYDSMKDIYSSIYNQQQAYEDQIASNERIAEMMNLFIDKFQDGSITYEEAMAGVSHLVNSLNNGFSNTEYLSSLLGISGTSDLTALLTGMEASASASVSQFRDYLQIVKANSDALNAYTSTWTEVQQNMQEQIKELTRLYEGRSGRSTLSAAGQDIDYASLSDIISNYNLADLSAYYRAPGINFASLTNAGLSSGSTNVEINMGNIELPNVRDADEFAKAINSQFQSIMRQEMTK